MLAGLEQLDPERRGLTAAEIMDRVYGEHAVRGPGNVEGLRGALDELLPKRDARTLGYRLRSYRRRVLGGRYLDAPETKTHGSVLWAVYPESNFGSRRAGASAKE